MEPGFLEQAVRDLVPESFRDIDARLAAMQGPDPVHRPAHYMRGRIEVIEFIEDQQLNYHLGQVIKYVCRAGHKDAATYVQDLEKARWYLSRAIVKHG